MKVVKVLTAQLACPHLSMWKFLPSVVKFYWVVIVSCCSCSVTQSRPTLRLRGLQHTRPPCPSPSPGICSSSCSLHRWCHLAIFSNALFFYCPQSFPALGTFPVNYLFASDDQNTGASASASVKIPVNIQWTVLFNRRKQQKGQD